MHYSFVINILHDLRDWRKGLDLAAMLEEAGYRTLIVTNVRDVERGLDDVGAAHVVNIDTRARLVTLDGPLDAEIERLKRHFDIRRSFYRLTEVGFLQDRPLYRDRRDAMTYAVKLLVAYERLMAEHTADYFFQPQADDIHRVAFYLAGRRYARHGCVLYTHSGLIEREILFLEDNDLSCASLRRALDRVDRPDAALVGSLRQRIIEAKTRRRYLPQKPMSLRARLNSARLVRERLLASRKSLLARKWLDELLRQRFRARAWRHAYARPRAGEPYVFYPMHAPIEGQTVVRGFAYRDEISLIRAIADSLPPGYRLYVKEHPGYEGARPPRDLREIRALGDRVSIIDPSTSSHELIRAAAVSVVVNSSVWLESLVLGRPVITLGRGLFSGYGVTREVADLGCLDQEIERAVSEPVEDEAYGRFLQALWEASYVGRWRYPQEDRAVTRQLFDALRQHLHLAPVAVNSEAARSDARR